MNFNEINEKKVFYIIKIARMYLIILKRIVQAYSDIFLRASTGDIPAPFSTNELTNNNIKEGGSNQKLILFSLGNAINFIIGRVFNSTFSLLLMSLDYVIL